MINVFIIDDHYLINDGFNKLFDQDHDGIHVVGSALNVEKALSKIPYLEVHVIVLDLFIKFLDPILNLNCLMRHFPSIPVIILSQETSLEWQINMFREGASAYISKEAEKKEILQIIYMVANGQTIIPIDISSELATKTNPLQNASLTCKEREIMQKMTTGFSMKEVAKQYNKSISSIEKSLKKIRQKFKAKTNFELIRILFQHKVL